MLHLTEFGLIYLPVALLILIGFRNALPGLLVVSTVLHAPAVVVVGTEHAPFGISPFLATCGLLALDQVQRVAAQRCLLPAPAEARLPITLWLAFLAWTILSALALPHLFEGLPVRLLSAKEPVLEAARPLLWGTAHLAQAGSAFALAIVLACFVATPPARLWRSLAGGFACAIILAAAIGAYQRLAMLGWVAWYPEFWGSNPSYNQNFLVPTYGPNMGRVGLPFSEPLYAGVWFAVAAAATYCGFVYGRARSERALTGLLFALALFGLANSLGTTGILAFAAFLTVMLAAHLGWGRHHTSLTTDLVIVLPVGIALLAGVAMVGLIIADAAPALADWSESGYRWVNEKYHEAFHGYRHDSDRDAVRVWLSTWGIGAGAGSLRASSYFTSLLGNVGLPGLVLWFAALGSTVHLVWRHRAVVARDACMWFGALLALVAGIGGGISDQAWSLAWIVLFAGIVLARRGADTKE
ncbi:MAG: hypothetical protein LKM32_02945 [Chiayiivirga sp.]|jgi:hypothetical protein|uniref:hypothetical protein n=1 Tax=Chiayiivirga sp. TaxID=2041042 RepID=UPI0025C530C9|nr:hypothetical protein [Chiayiivirga sp.]MCI1710763.1 hypothetical protein [Chiayiivirga sp.]MCI1728392.1 hypothetical protein [Chiayiivirga sp.]